ncbi:MAG: HAD-IIB family hydrolase [Sphaerochaeta sp.]
MWKGIIFCDIDGTLLPHGQKAISEEIFSLIKEARQSHYLFCISSGRFHRSMIPLFEPVQDDVVFSASNGSRIIYQGNDIIPNASIDPLLAEEIYEKLHAQKATALISTTEHLYYNSDYMTAERFLAYQQSSYARQFEHFFQVKGEILQITFLCLEHLEQILAFSRQTWGHQTKIAISGKNMFDISASSKGESLIKVSNAFKVPVSHTYAFGDDENDLSMLRAAGQGFLMSSGSDSLKTLHPHHSSDIVKTIRTIIQ